MICYSEIRLWSTQKLVETVVEQRQLSKNRKELLESSVVEKQDQDHDDTSEMKTNASYYELNIVSSNNSALKIEKQPENGEEMGGKKDVSKVSNELINSVFAHMDGPTDSYIRRSLLNKMSGNVMQRQETVDVEELNGEIYCNDGS